MRGRHKSQSTSKTFSPMFWAMFTAKFEAMKDFPSPGTALVIRMDLVGLGFALQNFTGQAGHSGTGGLN